MMKTEQERILDDLMDEYFDVFGENYPLFFTDMRSDAEVIDDIRRCLEEKKKKKAPKLDKSLIY